MSFGNKNFGFPKISKEKRNIQPIHSVQSASLKVKLKKSNFFKMCSIISYFFLWVKRSKNLKKRTKSEKLRGTV